MVCDFRALDWAQAAPRAVQRHCCSISGVLEALSPAYLASLLQDVVTGAPLKYRRTESGGFLLYSFGWNETDDGGTVASITSGGVDFKQGDWVWRYPDRTD